MFKSVFQKKFFFIKILQYFFIMKKKYCNIPLHFNEKVFFFIILIVSLFSFM